MKKILFYNFIPTKSEEEAAKASNTQFKASRALVEIRDLSPPPPPPDPNHPWQIRKRLTTSDVAHRRLALSHNDTFDHIFRYWTTDMVNYVLMGTKAPVVLWDLTDENHPLRYRTENIYLERGSKDEFYVLGWMDLISNLLLNPGDEIGLYWDVRSGTLQFKLLHRET
ncbi:hypothetical protein RJ639_028703 [Escallonia herrerae]|uniref:Uncharacterized protein n=1 Tax=Escallonia herrerae TaxID=1293975 RepID=A0AA89BEA6_9ASTE|nr:hypothetical protein RJ639_028703 [Escallonia herrerae]